MTAAVLVACGDGSHPGPLPDRTVVAPGLCDDPGLLAQEAPLAERLVLILHEGRYDLASVQSAAREAGIDPLGVEIVHEEDYRDDLERVAVILAGAAARAGGFAGSEPEHAKPVFPKALTRRGLLRRPAMQYIAAPLIDAATCVADRGCRVCARSCPYGALSWADGRIHYDKGACETCGRCITACPTGAVGSPSADPVAMAAQVRAMVGAAPGSMGIAFTCRQGRAWQPPNGWFRVEVPCTGMVPGTWIAALLLLGAAAGAAVPCSVSGCVLGGDAASESAVDLAQAMLAAAG